MHLPMELRTPPWKGRNGRFSPLRAAMFVLLIVPGLWTFYDATRSVYIPPAVTLVYWWGVWAVMLLLLTLFMTPARRIFRWNRAISIRRMLGVGALAYSLAHTVAYFALRNYEPGFIMVEASSRISLIVATLALIGLIALGLTSFDTAVKQMGARNWDRLHVGTYVFTGLAVFHFLLSPGAIAGLPFLMAGIFFWLMAWRFFERRRQGDRIVVLAGLTVAATVFTALLEPLWSATSFDTDPAMILGWNFTFQVGMTPAWQILALGTLVTVAAAARRSLSSTPMEKTAQ